MTIDNPYTPPTKTEPLSVSTEPVPNSEEMLRRIKREAGDAMVAGLASLFLGFVFAPIAIIKGRQALKWIEQYNIGHEHAARARSAIQLGRFQILILIVISCAVVYLIAAMVASGT